MLAKFRQSFGSLLSNWPGTRRLIKLADTDPDWIRIQSGHRIRIRNPDPDPGGQK
jgi:hypothetical protein